MPSRTKYEVAPCVGCGYCCKKVACYHAAYLGRVNEDGSCQELQHDGERYRCGLVLKPPDPGEDFWRSQLGIGLGCCSSLNTERKKYL